MVSLVLMTPECVYGNTLSTHWSWRMVVFRWEARNGSFLEKSMFLFFFSDVRGAFEVRAAVFPHEPPFIRHPTVLRVKLISNKHQQLVIKQHMYILHSPSHFSAANGCVKQIYDALSLSAFPLFHGSVASHGRRGEVFSRCSLVAALPSQQHFHSYTGRSFSAPFFFPK